jgi:hypothetical protein
MQNKLLLPLLCCFLSLLTAQAQENAPCMCINGEPLDCAQEAQRPNPHLLNGNSLVLQISDIPRSLGINPQARYKAFWMFGDGNFKYYPHGDMNADLATLRQPYAYHQTGTYTVDIVLSEKKSNKQPPDKESRVVIVDTITQLGSPFTQTLAPGAQGINILPNDLFRPKYPTAFAVSVPADPGIKGIYFFYNSKARTDGGFEPDTLHRLDEVILPLYIRKAGIAASAGLTANLPPELAEAAPTLKQQFRNFIYVPISANALAAMPVGFTEYRFFPVITTLWANGLVNGQIAALSVGDAAPTLSGFNASDLEKLSARLQTMFPGNAVGSNFVTGRKNDGSAVFIRGAVQFTMEMVGSIDPNQIKVEAIEDLKNGQFKATCRLEVCNKGRLAEDYVQVSVRDHRNLFSNFKLLSQDTVSAISEQILSDVHQWQFVWTALLDEVPWSGAYDKGFEEVCNDLLFSIETDALGLKHLIAGDGLELCSTFSLSNSKNPEECVCNLPIPDKIDKN